MLSMCPTLTAVESSYQVAHENYGTAFVNSNEIEQDMFSEDHSDERLLNKKLLHKILELITKTNLHSSIRYADILLKSSTECRNKTAQEFSHVIMV